VVAAVGAIGVAGSGNRGVARMREIGGRIARFTASSLGARFVFGACGSISETLSIAGLGGGGEAAGAVLTVAGPGFFAVIGAKADFVGGAADLRAGVDGGAGAGAASELVRRDAGTGSTAARIVARAAVSSVGDGAAAASALLFAFALLIALRGRVDDLAGAAVLAALRAGVLAVAVLLVVVFVGIF